MDRRQLVATIAAHGILAHNSAVSMPGEFALKSIYERLGSAGENIEHDLTALVADGHLRKRNTGYNGYGDHWVEGVDVWSVTQKGLITLWTGGSF